MPTYRFEEVWVSRKKSFKDPTTGKRKTVTRKFSQTLNPFNKLPNGQIKDYMDIMSEITDEADKWMNSSSTDKYGSF